jgi:cysteine desulfurase/selenocysteine lyase
MNSPAVPLSAATTSEIEALRADFPGLRQTIDGAPLAYLDSAASAQCPQHVLDVIQHQQSLNHANVHRGVYTLSERATEAYEGARDKIATYINAASREEIIFTSGTTESINLVASSLGRMLLTPGDEVIVTRMEHHSNIVPWQLICEQTGATIIVAPINAAGELNIDAFRTLLSERTRIVAVTHVSNALGTINPIREVTAAAHSAGAIVLVDGAQAMAHQRVDVQDLGCDFYAFSGHKMFAGTGTGILFGKRDLLDSMPPYQGGGEMILTVSFDETTYNALPYKFEAGTPNITGAVALGAAVDYLSRIDFSALERHEARLLEYAGGQLEELDGFRMVGTARNKAGVISFTMDGIHAHDLGTIVNSEGVAIRTGHHCAMPVMDYFEIPATARASFALYNNEDDIHALIRGIRRAQELFA